MSKEPEFNINDIVDTFEIIDVIIHKYAKDTQITYKTRCTKCGHESKKKIYNGKFTECKHCKLFKYKYEIGYEINGWKIINHYVVGPKRYYTIECMNCGNTNTLTDYDLDHNRTPRCKMCDVREDIPNGSRRNMYEYKYNVGDVVGTYKILDRFIGGIDDGRKKKMRYYKCQCIDCGTNVDKSESSLDMGIGCGVCKKCQCNPLINSVAVKEPWMVACFVNEEDAYKYTPCSEKRVEMKCISCGQPVGTRTIETVYESHGVRCPICADGYSIPEKFMYAILKHFCIEFKPQKIFDWAKDKRYDFYIPSLNMIIETHGAQHYKETPSGMFGSLDEIQRNDLFKYNMAIKNDIKNYIVIDCSDSEFDFLSFNIQNALSNYFDFSNVDMRSLYEEAIIPTMKKIIDMYNNGISKRQISEELNISLSTVYIKLNKLRKIKNIS